MTLDPTILRESFDLIIDRRPDLTLRFYEILFERSPELAPMFRRDRAVQAKMLARSIGKASPRRSGSSATTRARGAERVARVGAGRAPTATPSR